MGKLYPDEILRLGINLGGVSRLTLNLIKQLDTDRLTVNYYGMNFKERTYEHRGYTLRWLIQDGGMKAGHGINYLILSDDDFEIKRRFNISSVRRVAGNLIDIYELSKTLRW